MIPPPGYRNEEFERLIRDMGTDAARDHFNVVRQRVDGEKPSLKGVILAREFNLAMAWEKDRERRREREKFRDSWRKYGASKMLLVRFHRTWRVILVLLVFGIIFFLVGGFPLRQSALLVPMWVWFFFRIEERLREANDTDWRFTPYSVHVIPCWEAIVVDFKLVNSYEELETVAGYLKSSDYRGLRDGFRFTVLRQSRTGNDSLIYSNDQHAFTTKFELWSDAEPMYIDMGTNQTVLRGTMEARNGWQECLSVFMRPGMNGYELGIRVPEKWWNAAKPSCPSPLASKSTDGFWAELSIAAIPYSEFALSWEPSPMTAQFDYQTEPDIRTRQDGERERLGWAARDDLGDPHWSELSHKYFTVHRRSI